MNEDPSPQIEAMEWLGNETVAQAMHRQNVPRRIRIHFDLLAQPYHVRVHGAGVGIGFESPHRVQDHVARQWPVHVVQEECQKLVLQTGGFELSAVSQDEAPVEIYLHIAKAKDLIETAGGAP